jgi:hypothetical protein
MAAESRNLGVRLDTQLAPRLAACEKNTGIEGVSLARNLIAAALDYYEENGSITFPIAVIPLQELRLLQQAASSQTARKNIMAASTLLSEPAQSYSTKPKKKAV